jgi:hypothetical protein
MSRDFSRAVIVLAWGQAHYFIEMNLRISKKRGIVIIDSLSTFERSTQQIISVFSRSPPWARFNLPLFLRCSDGRDTSN